MKKILITGENSYIGTFVQNYLKQYSTDYLIETISVKGTKWKNLDFSPYDVVFHVAGIAHADTGKVTEEGKKLYYQVNRDLTFEVAEKLKKTAEKTRTIKQFIFMSSIIVYGENTSVNKKRIITKETEPNPSSFYGDSKWQGEQKLFPLKSDYFKLSILRPPMIYGPNSKGNYPQLAKLALKLPIFPNVKNQRSMLYVGNLAFFVKKVIDQNLYGTFLPHNKEIVQTSEMVQLIAASHHKNIKLFSGLNGAVKLLGYVPGKIGGLTNKAFGNLVIEKDDDAIENINLKESIELTEKEV